MLHVDTLLGVNRVALVNEVAARLRAERARLNLTLREAGELAGVHFVSLSRYEQGNKLPPLDIVYKLAEAYGIEPGTLMPPLASVADRKGRKRK